MKLASKSIAVAAKVTPLRFFSSVITLLVFVNCSRDLPEVAIGKIDSFTTPRHTFEVKAKNIDLGWYLGFNSDDIVLNTKLLESTIKVSVRNPTKVTLETAYRQQYKEVKPGDSVTIYEGLFNDFWTQGGGIIIHNFEDELNYMLEIECSQSVELTSPILIYLYTRDAEILPW